MNTDIGVIPRDKLPAQQAPANVAQLEAFVATFERRYAPRAIIASHADLALAWEPPAQINYFQSSPRIEISPTVNYEERYVFAAAPRELHGVPGPVTAAADASALFDRLFSRHARVAAFESQAEWTREAEPHRRAHEMPSRSEAVERVMPAAMPVERPSAKIDAAIAAPVTRDTEPTRAIATPSPAQESGWGTPFISPETPKPVTLPAPEIKRVAEQVMLEIDRRMVAQRERMGKR